VRANSTPAVSVCVPLFNGARYLAQCLASIAAQTFDDIEILVVDDGSTDEGVEIAREFGAHDRRCRVLENAYNVGLVANWNRCVEHARGRWIKFVFQDDVVYPQCLAELVRAASRKALLVACDRTLIFEQGVPEETKGIYLQHQRDLKHVFAQGPTLTPEAMQRIALEHFGLNLVGEPTSVLLDRRVFETYGAFCTAFSSLADLELWLRVGVNAGVVLIANELVGFRVHGTSASAANISRGLYRSTYLEKLILLRECVHSPHFAALRAKANDRMLHLEHELQEKMNEARAVAAWALQDNDEAPSRDWNELVTALPDLAPSDVAHLGWRVKRRFRPSSPGRRLF
jgi:glycosyltransferase involved in cell wall biosynthesis